MPFFNDWNPKKGGSNKVGANWIIANLDKRPRGSTLHIVDHEKGLFLAILSGRSRINNQINRCSKLSQIRSIK